MNDVNHIAMKATSFRYPWEKQSRSTQRRTCLLLECQLAPNVIQIHIRTNSTISSCVHAMDYLPGSSLCCSPWVVLGRGVFCVAAAMLTCWNVWLWWMVPWDQCEGHIPERTASYSTFAMLYRRPCWCRSPLAHSWVPHLHSMLLIGSLIVFNLASPGMLYAQACDIELLF